MMTHKFSFASGLFLIIAGGLMVAYNALATQMGLDLVAWRLAPIEVAIVALLFVLPPLFVPQRRGLSGLFIPGMPLLAVSALLLASQLLPAGFVWSRFWPQLIVAFALGLALCGGFLRKIWMAVPAAMILTFAAALQVTALTGWWWLWAGLWVTPVLALGLTLLAISAVRRSRGLRRAGAILSITATALGAALIFLVAGWWQAAGAVAGITLAITGAWFLALAWAPTRKAPTQVQA